MTHNGTFQILLYLAILLALVKPLGLYMGHVFEGRRSVSSRFLSVLERLTYKICRIDPTLEMNWKNYLAAMLFFNLLGFLLVYGLQRLQGFFPLNPQSFAAVAPDLSFNTAASFITNTDWQAYGGENSLSYLTQMLGLTVLNFFSAATGMAVLMAFIRGLMRRETSNLGNYWVDMVRGITYILLPLSLLLSLLLVSQGVIQNFKPYQVVDLLQTSTYQYPTQDAEGNPVQDLQGNPMMETKSRSQQVIPMGPAASQVAIKELGTNGGGFFNANSAHPFENPTPISNFFELLAVLLIPAALCYTFGYLVSDTRQGWTILIAMFLIMVPLIFTVAITEQNGNPALKQIDVDQNYLVDFFPGGNMEGKETRFGINNSALWASASTATANGSVNAMLDSFMPLAGLVPLWSLQLGEVVFGGVGSGLAGMLIFIILTVFVAGLMVGRTPEYLGKKIEPFEMKMASFVVLIMPLAILILTSIAAVTKVGVSAILNSGAHGFTEMLYAFSTMTENNGSAFAGLNGNLSFYNIFGGITMLLGRYWMFIPMLAIAGSLARKKTVPNSAGTLPTNTALFIILLVSVIIIVGALTFLPALALGPIVEHLMLWNLYVN